MFEDNNFEEDVKSEVNSSLAEISSRVKQKLDEVRASMKRNGYYNVPEALSKLRELPNQQIPKKSKRIAPILRRRGVDARSNHEKIIFDKELWENSSSIEKSSIFLAAIARGEEEFVASFLQYYHNLEEPSENNPRDKLQESAEVVENFIHEAAQKRDSKSLIFFLNQLLLAPAERLDTEFAQRAWVECSSFRFLRDKKDRNSIVSGSQLVFESAIKGKFFQNQDLEPLSQKTISGYSNIIENVFYIFKDEELSPHHPLIALNSSYLSRLLPSLDQDLLKRLWQYSCEQKNSDVLSVILSFYKEKFPNGNYLQEVAKLEDDESLAKSLPARLFNILSQAQEAPQFLKKDLWQEIRNSGNRSSKKRDFGLKIQKRIWFGLALQEETMPRRPSVVRAVQILDILSFCDIDDKNSLIYAHNPKTARAMSPLAILGAADLAPKKANIAIKYWNSLDPERQRQIWLEAVAKKRGDVLNFIINLLQQKDSRNQFSQIASPAQVVEVLSYPIREKSLATFFFLSLDQKLQKQIWFDAATKGNLEVLSAINHIYKLHQNDLAQGLQSPIAWQDENKKTALIKVFEQENISAKSVQFLFANGAKINSDAESKFIGKAFDDFKIRFMQTSSGGQAGARSALSSLSELQSCVTSLRSSHASRNFKALSKEIERFSSTTPSYEIDDERKALILQRIKSLPEIVQGASEQDFANACQEVFLRCTNYYEFKVSKISLLWTGCTSSYAGTFFNEWDVLSDKYKSVLACALCDKDSDLSVVAKNPQSQFRAIFDGFRNDNFDKITEICKEVEDEARLAAKQEKRDAKREDSSQEPSAREVSTEGSQLPPSDAAKPASAASLQQQQSQQKS